jgi:hypothetical protein
MTGSAPCLASTQRTPHASIRTEEAIPILVAYQVYLSGFTKGSFKEITRVLCTAGTPIHSHYSETMAGNSTIRAFNTEKYAIDRNLELNNERSVAFEVSITGFIWFSI